MNTSIRFFSLLRAASRRITLMVRTVGRASHARGYARLYQATLAGGLTALANESATDRVSLFGLTNEIDAATGDGWARIGYGEWPHERGLQRFGRAQADEMVGYFKNTWNRIKRAVVGMPIFRGHPDLKAIANQYPDKGVYGAIADMEARDDGLYIRPILSEEGAALVNEKGLKYFSPHWLARKLPDENGRPVYAPAFMVSIGLTDRPNIGGTSLVNSAPVGANENNKSENIIMLKWLIELLGLANEATEEQVKAKVTDLLKRPEPTALANEQTARTTAETQLTEAKNKLTTAETALANERTAHAATAKARNEALVASAIKDGRVVEANRQTWLSRLDRDFATESTALANEKPVVKMQPRTANLGARKQDNAARDQFTALVNEALPKNGGDWDRAWAAVKATPNGKTLFEQMDAEPAK